MTKITYTCKPCMRCGKVNTLEVDEGKLNRWRNGELIQRAFPELIKDQREMMISGTCPECWNKLFK